MIVNFDVQLVFAHKNGTSLQKHVVVMGNINPNHKF